MQTSVPNLGLSMSPKSTKVLLVLLTMSIGALSSGLVNTASASTNSTPIPSTFFAMTMNHASAVTTWPTIGTLGKDNSEDWGFVEKSQGIYNWKALDDDIGAAQSRGVTNFIYTFLHTPEWASSQPTQPCGGSNSNFAGCAAPPANISYWNDFVTALVTRYKGEIQYYEVWNEPNNPQSWSGTISDMLTLAQNAYSIIKSIDPNALVLTPGVAVGGVQPVSSGCSSTCWLEQYLQAGGGQYADIITWHAYHCLTGQYGLCNNGIGCTEAITCAGTPLLTQIGFLNSYLTGDGLAGKAIIDTEGGWGKNQNLPDADQQAAYVSRWFALQASQGIKVATWYAWNGDTLSDPNGWGTMWTPTEGESKAATAYAQTYDWLVGASFTSPCSLSGSLWSCGLTRPGGYQGLILWADSNSSILSYAPASAFVQYRDLTGNTHTISAGSTISVGDKPIILESGSPIPEFDSQALLVVTVLTLSAVALFSHTRLARVRI